MKTSPSRRSTLWFAGMFTLAIGVIGGVIILGKKYDEVRNPLTNSAVPILRKNVSGATDGDRPPRIVGLQACTRCHPKQSSDLATSGHSQTFHHTSRSEIAKSLHGQTFMDPERKYVFHYKFDPRDGLSVNIPGKLDKYLPLPYALGSGNHAVTFLSLIPDRASDGTLDTVGIEHRVSVFPHATINRLALTPGHTKIEPGQEVENFGKIELSSAAQTCVSCHTTEGTIFEASIHDLRENVTCERCHGPGSRHVAAAEGGDPHPKFLELTAGSHDSEAQVRLCGRCHRVPEMMEGRKLQRSDLQLTRFQPIGLMQSRCYRESQGELNCSTCHDPHRGTRHDKEHYIQQCLKCHRPHGGSYSSCPVSPDADCLRCHMPAVPSVHEVSFSDHWIRVRDKEDPQPLQPIPLPKRRRP